MFQIPAALPSNRFHPLSPIIHFKNAPLKFSILANQLAIIAKTIIILMLMLLVTDETIFASL